MPRPSSCLVCHLYMGCAIPQHPNCAEARGRQQIAKQNEEYKAKMRHDEHNSPSTDSECKGDYPVPPWNPQRGLLQQMPEEDMPKLPKLPPRQHSPNRSGIDPWRVHRATQLVSDNHELVSLDLGWEDMGLVRQALVEYLAKRGH